MNMAVIKTGGKQYLVKPQQKLKTEKLLGAIGSSVIFNEVLLVTDDNSFHVGTPTVAGAKVTATITAQGRGKKIIVQKYKPKVRYQKKLGHRQPFTEVIVENIEHRT